MLIYLEGFGQLAVSSFTISSKQKTILWISDPKSGCGDTHDGAKLSIICVLLCDYVIKNCFSMLQPSSRLKKAFTKKANPIAGIGFSFLTYNSFYFGMKVIPTKTNVPGSPPFLVLLVTYNVCILPSAVPDTGITNGFAYIPCSLGAT